MNININYENEAFVNAEYEKVIERVCQEAAIVYGLGANAEISILLCHNEYIHQLNKQYRQIDRPTDVLSFPANELIPGCFEINLAELNPKTGRVMLGDMALSLEHAIAQGKEFGHGTKREIQYLTVHSVLHLLGYDHVDEGEGKREMRSREKEIMATLEGVREE